METRTEALSTFAASGGLLGDLPLESKVAAVHRCIHDEMGYHPVGRIAIATFEQESGRLGVYAFSDLLGKRLRYYSMLLSDVPTLQELALSGRARVVRDMMSMGNAGAAHTVAVRMSYRSSLTIPIRKDDRFHGFVFFNADKIDYFNDQIVERILPYGQLLAAMTLADLERINTIKAAVDTARQIHHLRDDETGGHLHRVAAYSQTIANAIAPKYDLSERWIDLLTHFAPLHDIGKVGVPDNILFKPGKLTPEEYELMKNHVDIGVETAKSLLENFNFTDKLFGSLLVNVVACHHETLDGKGYPNGLVDDAIPLEGRIVAVADIFDALTCDRPYKKAWTVDDALDYTVSLSGSKLDSDCVAALIANRDRIAPVMTRYNNGHNAPSAIAA